MLPAPPPTDAAPPPHPPSGLSAAASAGPGQLTPGWRIALGAAWAGVFVGFTAVWKASRDIGLSTWWLGPGGEPQPLYVMLLPFLAPAVMVAGALYGMRFLPWAGLLAAGVTAAIGVGDIGRVDGLALAELTLAAGGAAVSAAALGGRYRR